jgi:cell wall-associated NlpC family hydrolase
LTIGLLLLSGMLVAGCTSSRPSTDETTTVQAPDDVEPRLRSAADQWDGVPHKWGGTSQQGVDCSGLVQSVYASQFGVSLPRTTEDQVSVGRKVRRSALRPGDLVFFRHARKKYHVGIYLSDGEFLHASSSTGVTVSALDQPYWTERWWQARRLLSVSPDSSRTPPSPASGSSSVGW